MKKKKIIKGILKIIIIACLVILPGYFILNSIIEKKIRQQFTGLSPALRLKFSGVHANIFSSSVSFDSLDINFIPYKTRQENKHHLFFPRASLKGVRFLKFLFTKNLVATSLLLDKGNVQLDSFLLDKKDSAQSGVFNDVKWPFKKLFIRSVEIKTLKAFLHSKENDQPLANADIIVDGISIDQPGKMPAFAAVTLHLSNVDYSSAPYKLRAKELTINSKRKSLEIVSLFLSYSQKDLNISKMEMTGLNIMKLLNDRRLSVERISVGPSKMRINYQGIEIKSIEFNSKKEKAEIEGINIIPELGKYEFGEKLGHQADRIQATISEIEITKPDLDQLPDQKFRAEKILISNVDANIFRDRRLPRPEKNIPLPADYIKKLPIDIRINDFELRNATVAYEEYPKAGYGKTGTLKIEKIKLSLSSLISHPLSSDPAFSTMTVEASIMGSGTAHAVIQMPNKENEPYHVQGVIEKLELTKLNSSSENLGKIRIKSGFLDFLFFDFTMTQQKSTGKIIGAYHHLIIQQLKKHTTEKNVADFASFALRHAIIPLNKDSSLPEKKRTGYVDYTRDPTRMVSYYLLQSLLTGVKKSFTLGFLLPK